MGGWEENESLFGHILHFMFLQPILSISPLKNLYWEDTSNMGQQQLDHFIKLLTYPTFKTRVLQSNTILEIPWMNFLSLTLPSYSPSHSALQHSQFLHL